MASDAHRHEWDISVVETGDTLARCRCGRELLLTGTVVRYRSGPHESWETPFLWNRHYYRPERRKSNE